MKIICCLISSLQCVIMIQFVINILTLGTKPFPVTRPPTFFTKCPMLLYLLPMYSYETLFSLITECVSINLYDVTMTSLKISEHTLFTVFS